MRGILTIVFMVFFYGIFAQNDAQFVAQSVDENLQAGAPFTISITFKNTGTTTWTDSALYHIGTQNPQDNFIFGVNRLLLPQDVPPGEEVTVTATLTAPSEAGLYYFQWQMVQDGVEWFGEKSEAVVLIIGAELAGDLFRPGKSFSTASHIVSTSFFTWFSAEGGQQSSPWIPLEGRETWTGTVSFWMNFIKEVMACNIDVLYVELIPYMENQRGNLFMALYLLRSQGWEVPKVCPFLDPEITYSLLGYHGDCSTEEGKDELVGHYIRFYNQYFAVNTDAYADDFVYTQDGHPVLDIWHIQLHIDHYNQLTRDDVTSRLSAAFGTEHPIFNNDIKMINNAYSPAFSFADERIYQFEMQSYKIDKNWNGINSSLLKPGYWDQNVRYPGYLLPRDGGTHYADSWAQVNADTTIDRVYIESFNEYDEGSGIYAARTDTIYKKTGGGVNNTGNDVWSLSDDPYEYIRTTAQGAKIFNDNPGLDASFIQYDVPPVMTAGDTVQISLTVRNDGDEKWSAAAAFALRQNTSLDEISFGNPCPLNDSLDDIPAYGGIIRGRTKIFSFPVVVPAMTGTHTVHWQMFQGDNTWFGDTLAVTFNILPPEGQKEEANQIFAIYPNPAKEVLNISTPAKMHDLHLSLYDGKGVLCKEIPLESGESTLSLRGFPASLLFVEIKDSQGKTVHRQKIYHQK